MSTITATLVSTLALAKSLDAVRIFIRRFVVLSAHQATTIALWIAHTHAFDAFDCTPYQQITSPTKRAGKTRLLEVEEPLVARAWFTGRTSAAALVRNIDSKRPTLLLDESDAAFNGEKEYGEALRSVLNTGYRRSGRATICVGQGSNVTVRDFQTFCPKAIAGIGDLPGTVADRAIPIALQRRKSDEPCERWRERDGRLEAMPLRESLAAAVAPLMDELRDARPVLLDCLSDRAADVWEPLLAIADAAGGEWPRQARAAARVLSGSIDENDITIDLLRDIRDVLAEDHDPAPPILPTTELIAKLVERDDRPWATWRRGDKPITGRGLARLLGPLGVHVARLPNVRGYRRDAFTEAFARYLPIQASLRQNLNNDGPGAPISMCQNDVTTDTLKTAKRPIETGLSDGMTDRGVEAGKGGQVGLRLRF